MLQKAAWVLHAVFFMHEAIMTLCVDREYIGSVVNMEYYSETKNIEVTYTPERLLVPNSSTTQLAASGTANVSNTILCHTMIKWKIIAIQNDLREHLFMSDNTTLGNIKNIVKGNYMEGVFESIIKCTNIPKELCPLHGWYEFKKCLPAIKINFLPISNTWKCEIKLMGDDGRVELGGYIILKWDDGLFESRKRPTSGQKRRRKH